MGRSLKHSAGILLFRNIKEPEVLLVHPGGPFWAKKDLGAWSIPKGEYNDGEDPLVCACREFKEETGGDPGKVFTPLTPLKQKSGKIVSCWASEGEFDPADFKSNFFDMEWPPRSGKFASFPEVDKAAWFKLEEAKQKILPGQLDFLTELQSRLKKRATGK